MINIQCFEEYGTPVSGRGTSLDLGDLTAHPELGNWNLKMSPNPLHVYYPTQNSSGYAIQRPTLPGQLVYSYKKYIYFGVSGTYSTKLKDLKLQLEVTSREIPDEPQEPNLDNYPGEGAQYLADQDLWTVKHAQWAKEKKDIEDINSSPQVQKYNLFYKMSNVYAAPTNSFPDGMICAGAEPSLILFPKTGTSPLTASTRSIVYGPNQTFYTNYIVLQIAATNSTWTDVGNTAELNLKFSFREFL